MLKLQSSTEDIPLAPQIIHSQNRSMIEQLLEHYFSSFQSCYNEENIIWLLETVNSQHQWIDASCEVKAMRENYFQVC